MVTSLFASILALFYFKMSVDTIKARHAHKVSLGHGPNGEISGLVSAHSNFASYVPLLVILTYLAEVSGRFPVWVIGLVATIYTSGRVLHYSALRSAKMNLPRRVLGMQMTLLPIVALALMNIYACVAAQLWP